MFKLNDEQLAKAKEIALSNRRKKSCGECYDRGYIGTTEENLLILCPKCVDLDKAMEDWKDYVAEVPELKEEFSDLFEEASETEEEIDVTKLNRAMRRKNK
jgi:hypothetical protein